LIFAIPYVKLSSVCPQHQGRDETMWRTLSFCPCGGKGVLECMASRTPIKAFFDLREEDEDSEVRCPTRCLLLKLEVAPAGEPGLLATLEFEQEDLPQGFRPGTHVFRFHEAYYFVNARIPESMCP